MLFRKIVLFTPLLLALVGCANMTTVEQTSEAGTTQIFSHPVEAVSSATLQSVQALNVSIKKTEKRGEAFEIYFSKPVSVWSWGEVGKVSVRPLEPNATVVEVNAEKRSQLQLTGTNEQSFADAIFSGIERRLSP